ncbi:MAG TPA: sulfatase-like hydrolase/transferase [Mycobacteriales bacterium]|nr:sulfatase-like hydrolase/transferase [Mycobacteriales bacterium]
MPANVLILKSDEHNPFIASTVGHPFIRTPNMERLAALGTLYESAYCPSPLCTPSRSSYLTGLPVHEIQCYNNCLAVPRPNFPTYGGVLAAQGVHTMHIGKVDGHRRPDELGFSEMYGHIFRGDNPDNHVRRNPVPARKNDPRPAMRGVRDTEIEAFGAHAVHDMQRALDFLTGRAAELDRPWTLEVNLSPPHFPHHVTRELWDLYADHEDLPEFDVTEPSADHPYCHDIRYHTQQQNMLPVAAEHRRAYYGRVTWVDQQLGRLLDAVDAAGLRDSTVVGYTSDHGEMLGKFGMWWKSSMFEDSVRVPLILAGPGFSPGVRVSTPVSQWDLQATVFRSVDARRPGDWWGEPLQDLAPADEQRAVFSEYSGHGTRASAFMIRQGRWKFVWNAVRPHQLFDLQDDPNELRNLAGEQPDRVAQLTELLRGRFCDPDLEQQRAEEFINEQLRAMEAAGVEVP